jgi:hypothetical protein
MASVSSPRTAPLTWEAEIRLLNAYSLELENYGRSVELLDSVAGKVSAAEYEEIRANSENLKARMEQARAAVDKHLEEHG